MRDDPEVDIIFHFLKIINFLESEEQIENKKILFHCVEGISRAPAMVAGYLMWKNKFKFDEVIELIKSKRDCVDINLGFQRRQERQPLRLRALQVRRRHELPAPGPHLRRRHLHQVP